MRLLQSLSFLAALFLLGVATGQSADQLFETGVNAYRSGDIPGAVTALKAALAENPGHEQAFLLLDKVEQRVLMDMLTERGELGGLTDRFLAIAELGRREIVEDAGAAAEVVNRLLAGNEEVRQNAILELRSTYGSWAVPALIGPLGDSASIDNRVSAIQALIRIGSPAVQPLVATLSSADPLLRRNAAAVLGSIGDRRAAGALAWMATADDDEGARAAAAEGLSKMGAGGTDAVTMARLQAEAFLRGNSELVRPYDATTVWWVWDDGQLLGERVLGGLIPLLQAEALLLVGLEHGAGDQMRPLLAAVHAAMKSEIEAASMIPALADHELVIAAQNRLEDLDLNLALAGRHRGAALGICLSGERRLPLAAATLMQHMDGSSNERAALRLVLRDPDALVSQGAALALARLGQLDAEVARELGSALAGVPQRLVISIGPTGLGGSAPGWLSLMSPTVLEGMLRAKTFPPKDVVVIRDGAQGVTLDAIIHGLRNDPRTEDVPIIVVTDDVVGVEGLYGDVVSKVGSSVSMSDVTEVAGDRNEAQVAMVDHASEAAAALMGAPANLVAAAGPQIASGLQSGAEDDLLVALLNLVAHGGVMAAKPDVEARIGDDSASPEVRVATMKAAARLWALSGGQAGGDYTDVLLAAIEAGDPDLASAAAEALGQLQDVPSMKLRGVVR